MVELILLVAMAWWGGSPASRYAGSEISPPPPAMASTKPARKTSGQIISRVFRVSIGGLLSNGIIILKLYSHSGEKSREAAFTSGGKML